MESVCLSSRLPSGEVDSGYVRATFQTISSSLSLFLIRVDAHERKTRKLIFFLIETEDTDADGRDRRAQCE